MSEDDSREDDWFEGAFADDADENGDSDSVGVADDASEDTVDGDDRDADGGDWSGDDQPFATSDAASGGVADESDSPFGDTGAGGFESGEGSTDSPFGDTGVDDSDPFGGDSSPFEDGDGGGEDDLFDESFADAMGGSSDKSDDFDDDIDSDIPRLDLGIEGLDNMIQGGIPQRHLMVIIGGAGTGKTTFGLQFLRHGLNLDETEKGVFITLEQTHEDIMATADERGWEFRRHEEEGNLAVVDLDPVEMANSLDNIRGELPELIEDFGADRFVLDSVSLLEMMYDEQSRRRTEIFDFTQSLKDAGVTTVFTSEANDDNPYASRHGIIEYLTDAVFLLRYVRSETQETRLAVEIQKIRNANHSRETKPYEITLDGISVYEQANIF